MLLTVLFLAVGIGLSPTRQSPEVAARFDRAFELQRQGLLREAVEEYRAVVRAAPDYAEAHANLGSVLSRLGQGDEAISSYETALRLNPKLTPVLLNLGIIYFRLGQFTKAADALERFLAATPGSAQARGLLGLALVELGRDKDAVPHLEATLAVAGEDPAVLYALGLTYLRLDRPEFRKMADRLAAIPSGGALSHLLLGQSLLAKASYQLAVDELQQAAKLNPELPRLHYSLGLSFLMMGDRQQAIASFKNELDRKPNDFWSLYYLATAHEAEGNDDSARQYLDAALKLEPKSPEVNGMLGKLLVKQNKYAEALAPLEAAVADPAADSSTHYLLARVYQRLGRRKDAEREFAETERLKGKQLERERSRALKP
ncbi:MAG TPA: tetratricopeptide repeat protein [Blastocatellia bacterium]|nr:tetratricopeptide repeat protein [Blastocatellia bacterium]